MEESEKESLAKAEVILRYEALTQRPIFYHFPLLQNTKTDDLVKSHETDDSLTERSQAVKSSRGTEKRTKL